MRSAAGQEALQKHLPRIYAHSTFNTCPHRPLPRMTGPSLRLMLDEDATPVTHHTPIPVAIHWQYDDKASLDKDVRLVMLEEAPIGTPVTWCHRMVIGAKKNGKPRRTFDFMANKQAFRETITLNPRSTRRDAYLTGNAIPYSTHGTSTTASLYTRTTDGYARRYDENVAYFGDKTKCVDDTLLWSDTIEGSYFHAA